MSNLEHIFESALEYIKDGYDLTTWIGVMTNGNCNHNAKCTFVQRTRNGQKQIGAELNDGRIVCLNDIWELAQYTHPWMKMAEDLAKEGPKKHYRICKLSDDDNKKKWIVEGPNIFTV